MSYAQSYAHTHTGTHIDTDKHKLMRNLEQGQTSGRQQKRRTVARRREEEKKEELEIGVLGKKGKG